MGFVYKEVDNTTCVFEATEKGDDHKDIAECVQKAFRSAHSTIVIDFLDRSEALIPIFHEVESLQKVSLKNSRKLEIRVQTGKLPPDAVSRLKQTGVRILTQSVISPGAGEGFPPYTQIEGRVKSLRQDLAEGLLRKRSLEQESHSYEERLKVISLAKDKINIDSSKIKKIEEMEKELVRQAEENHAQSKKLSEAQELMQTTEATIKSSLSDLKSEHKKKVEPFGKKIAELQKKQQQAKSDFEKKANERNTKWAALQNKNQKAES